MMTLLLAQFACVPTAKVEDDTAAETDTDTDTDSDTDTDTDADTDTDTDTDPPSYSVVVATVASDYTAGQLATVDGASGSVMDEILPTNTDPVVIAEAGKVFLLQRFTEDTVRMYNPGDWSAPVVEFSTGDASNPQDVGVCGDKIVVSMLAADHLGVYDAGTGLATGTIDLSSYADADGYPEPDSIVTGADGDLYVGLGMLDTSAYPWVSADGTGTVVRVDCDTLEVADDWTTGPNPSLMKDPRDPTKMLIRTGDYYNDDYSAKIGDGAVYPFNPATGEIGEALLTEDDVGANIGAIAGGSDGKVIVITDNAYSWSLSCVDLSTGTITPTDPVDSYIGDAEVAPDGHVWVAYRAGYAGNGDPVVAGLQVWNPEDCTAAPTIETLFPPYSLAIAE